MGWLTNNGDKRLASFHPAAQFRNSLYRPDVIKHVLKTGKVAKALELADKEKGQATALLDVAKVLPPIVAVTSPDKVMTETAEANFEVGALALSVGGRPIQSLRLLVNGRPYVGGEKTYMPPRGGEIRERWRMELTPGSNVIQVQAESAVSKSLSEPVEVLYEKARGIKRVPGEKDNKQWDLPNLYVLAVGVGDYPHAAMKLRYAAKDAQVLSKTLQAGADGLYGKVEVKVLTDKDATLRNVRQGLGWLKKQMTQRDLAIVFFAGHGEQDSDGIFYLLPVDVDADDVASTALPSGLIKEALQSIPGRVLLLLDACHSGAVGGRRSGGAITDDLRRDLVSDECGVVVMCSSTGKEVSLESAVIEHGLFTKALVEGLAGKADYNRDQVIYSNELDLYVSDRVKELSNGRQHPVTNKPSSVRPFPLSQMKQSPGL